MSGLFKSLTAQFADINKKEADKKAKRAEATDNTRTSQAHSIMRLREMGMIPHEEAK